MKQTITIIISLFLFSCNNDTVTIPKEEYKQLKGDTIKSEYPREIIWYLDKEEQKSYIVKIENHEMLIGNINRVGYSFYLTHYPDCKYCKKDTL